MKLQATFALLAASLAEAHYVLYALTQEGQSPRGDWGASNVRITQNFQSNGPVENVMSPAMTCYQRDAGSAGVGTLDVTAGSTVTMHVRSSVSHPGPLIAYMAKAPGAAADFDGKGEAWFKIYQDGPNISPAGMTWPSQGKSRLNIPIPSCIEDGEYLLRVEHIGLHSAGSPSGAQLYISCGQVRVTGGSGSARPSLMSFPGAYTPRDPGLLINIYWPIPTSYTPPGGAPMQC